jgi:hypothetical protein
MAQGIVHILGKRGRKLESKESDWQAIRAGERVLVISTIRKNAPFNPRSGDFHLWWLRGVHRGHA